MRGRSALRLAAAWVLILVTLLVLVEGGASALIFARDVIAGEQRLAESVYTQYDSLLGWSNRPSTTIPDMYGKGVRLTINAQGFRADRPTTTERTAGTKRVICLGDSFTLGYGVANDRTWCHVLSAIAPNLETVNMGQGGYGLDQAYLWYMRDGQVLNHDLLIVSIITVDLERMMDSRFLGYPKPTVSMDGGRILIHNVPVPHSSMGRYVTRMTNAASRLRLVELSRRLSIGPRGAARTDAPASMAAARDLAIGLVGELKQATEQHGTGLVVVWLPTRADFSATGLDSLRARFAGKLAKQHIAFVDMIPALRALPADRLDQFFIPHGALDFANAAGHYTVAGNEWAARTLYARLMADTLIGRMPTP